MRLAGTLLAVAVLILPLSAQMRGPVSAGRGITINLGQRPPAHPFLRHDNFPAIPFFYPDYASEPVVVQSPPQVVVVQAQPAPAEAPEPSKPKLLMIEWRGDRYLRITGAEDPEARTKPTQPDYSEEAVVAKPRNPAAPQPHPLLPAVIVFRDGRRAEVASYTIVGTVMYAGKDYWTDGSWNEKVQLADLDVPATLRLNQERGVKFLLPAGPNEVVTRP
jgi:hypothetical protein